MMVNGTQIPFPFWEIFGIEDGDENPSSNLNNSNAIFYQIYGYKFLFATKCPFIQF